MSFAPAVATVSGRAELALGGTVGYRVSRQIWFEGDVTWIDGAANNWGRIALPVEPYFPFIASRPTSVVPPEMLSRSIGLLPPGCAGSGINRICVPPGGISQWVPSMNGSTFISTIGVRWEMPVETEHFRPYVATGFGLNYTTQTLMVQEALVVPGFFGSDSHTGAAFSVGGGASIHIAKALWADVDAKYFRLSRDRNTIKLGGGISVRF